MKEITVKTQAELDKLPQKFDEFTNVYIKSEYGLWLTVRDRRENASVVARENASVEARGNVGVRSYSSAGSVVLFACSVAWDIAKANITKKSPTATVITPPPPEVGTDGWLEREGVSVDNASVVLFKRVSRDWKTQEGTSNETDWKSGTTLEHPAWKPDAGECGSGKFHACSRAYFCDEFRGPGNDFGKTDDRYVAIEIKKSDLYVWETSPQYPHKIAFRKGLVLYECTKHGKKKEVV